MLAERIQSLPVPEGITAKVKSSRLTPKASAHDLVDGAVAAYCDELFISFSGGLYGEVNGVPLVLCAKVVNFQAGVG